MRNGIVFAVAFAMVISAFVLASEDAGAKKPKDVIVDDDGPADYSSIQTAINSESDGTKIKVMPGSYAGFVVNGRNNLKIEKCGKGTATVTGSVSVPSYRGTQTATIGVTDSQKIEIKGFKVTAGNTDPHTIAYFDSTGKIKKCETSGNTGNANPGNGIAVFGISSPGEVKVENNYVHGYGKIGILVNSWNPSAGAAVNDGVKAKIKGNTIVGTDFSTYNRVQDGIQVTYGGTAKIEKNRIHGNLQTGGSAWTCDGIMVYEGYKVETKGNKIYDNQMGIAIQKVVYKAKLDKDRLYDNEWGLYTWNWLSSQIEVKKARIYDNEYGWVNWDTDGIKFKDCRIEKNDYGIYTDSYMTSDPSAYFDKCKIRKNTNYDVVQGSLPTTLYFKKVKYDTHVDYGGGTLIET